MRLLLLNQYYVPDMAPTGQVLHNLARVLARRGHEVTVLCSRRSYDGGRLYPASETIDGVNIVRLSALGFGRRSFVGKLLDYISFYLLLAVKLMLVPKPDVILALTTPPFIGLLAKVAAMLRGAKHAHWVMDLYPDVMHAHGMLHHTSFPYRVLAWLTHLQLKGSVLTLVLGPDMAERVGKYVLRGEGAKLKAEGRSEVGSRTPNVERRTSNAEGRKSEGGGQRSEDRGQWTVDGGRTTDNGQRATDNHSPFTTHHSQSSPLDLQTGGVHWIPLWGDLSLEPWPEDEANPLREERGWHHEKLVLMYSGNMGLGHRFEELLTAAEELSHDDGVHWTFAGGGKRRAQVEEFAQENPEANIELLPYAPLEQLRHHLCSADVLLASLDKTWQGCMVPSKIQGIFAVGKPVIFVGEANNSLAHWITDSGGGWVVSSRDVEALHAAIAEARDPTERSRRGLAARRYAEEHFHVETNCIRIAELLEATGRLTEHLLNSKLFS